LNENESELTATMNKLMIVKLLFVLHLCQCVRAEVIHAGTRKLRYYLISIETGFELTGMRNNELKIKFVLYSQGRVR